MHVNPMTSDHQFTIGYDDNGVAGRWPGKMTRMCEPADWIPAREGAEFSDGNEVYTATRNGNELVWTDSDGYWKPIREVLNAYGDR